MFVLFFFKQPSQLCTAPVCLCQACCISLALEAEVCPPLGCTPPPPPLRSGCESEAWFRHPGLPTHYFLSRIENERGWWLRARCFRLCEWFCVCVCACVLSGKQNLIFFFALVWQGPEGWCIQIFVFRIGVALYTLCDVAVYWHLFSNQNKVYASFFFFF